MWRGLVIVKVLSAFNDEFDGVWKCYTERVVFFGGGIGELGSGRVNLNYLVPRPSSEQRVQPLENPRL